MLRGSVAAVAVALVTSTVVVTAPPAADAATRVSTRFLLNHLVVTGEHGRGYDRAKFAGWVDADHDGCDTREEVLIKEAVRGPRVASGCALSAGKWISRYDGVPTVNPSGFDIDHMVPLAEAWASGAWRWTDGTRDRYANDLGYPADLIAVTAHANRSKGDREPQDWMPERTSYRCTYLANWVAVKWRWRLRVNGAEHRFLHRHLKRCGWPSVSKPGRPTVAVRSRTGGSGGSGGGTDPRFAYCYQAIDAGYGPYYSGRDPEYDWYTDSDHDGVVCES